MSLQGEGPNCGRVAAAHYGGAGTESVFHYKHKFADWQNSICNISQATGYFQRPALSDLLAAVNGNLAWP